MNSNQYLHMAELQEKHWWFAARRNILGKLIKAHAVSQPECKIMEVGSGTGSNFEWLIQLSTPENITFVEKDAYARELFFQNTGHKALEGTLPCRMPRLDNQDIICMFDVLEHIEEDDLALRQLANMLKPRTGRLFITVPAHPILYSMHDRNLMHYRRYSKKKSCSTDSRCRTYHSSHYLLELVSISHCTALLYKR